MDALMSLQGGRLGEVFATNVAAVGFAARVAHAVAQQALGVGEGLCTNLQSHDSQDQSQSCISKSCMRLHLLKS